MAMGLGILEKPVNFIKRMGIGLWAAIKRLKPIADFVLWLLTPVTFILRFAFNMLSKAVFGVAGLLAGLWNRLRGNKAVEEPFVPEVEFADQLTELRNVIALNTRRQERCIEMLQVLGDAALPNLEDDLAVDVFIKSNKLSPMYNQLNQDIEAAGVARKEHSQNLTTYSVSLDEHIQHLRQLETDYLAQTDHVNGVALQERQTLLLQLENGEAGLNARKIALDIEQDKTLHDISTCTSSLDLLKLVPAESRRMSFSSPFSSKKMDVIPANIDGVVPAKKGFFSFFH